MIGVAHNNYLLEFREDGNLEQPADKLFIIDPGDRVTFRLSSSSPLNSKPMLITNFPQHLEGNLRYTTIFPNEKLSHSQNKEIQNWEVQEKKVCRTVDPDEEEYLYKVEGFANDFGSVEFEVEFNFPGPFFIQIEYYDNILNTTNYSTPYWIQVRPRLIANSEEVPIETLNIQSVLSRSLGLVERWTPLFKSQSYLNYNAIHFTPIQPSGFSGSLYSLKDHLQFSDIYFHKKQDNETKLELITKEIVRIEEETNMISFCDIVLNHVAVDSEWLLEHPEAAYNTLNSPYLESAWVLDNFIQEFSSNFSQSKVPECSFAPYINNRGDMQILLGVMNEYISDLRIWEYFMYDISMLTTQLRSYIRQGEQGEIHNAQLREQIKYKLGGGTDVLDLIMLVSQHQGEAKFGVTLDIQFIANLLIVQNYATDKMMCDKLQKYLTEINKEWKLKIKKFQEIAMENIKNTIIYEKLELRNTKITSSNPIIRRYFIQLNNPQRSVVAHNGWIYNSDPSVDFASKSTWAYLKREIVIWDDSVKLFYGQSPRDNPFIWGMMTEYVVQMAKVFHGFRLDNAHSTPKHLLRYLLQKARSLKPDLYVFGELFTNSRESDTQYCRELGINSLIRETLFKQNSKEMGDYIYEMGRFAKFPIGMLDTKFTTSRDESYEYLISEHPPALIYDMTHDNPSPFDNWNPCSIVPIISMIGMTDVPIGTTRGVDELIPKNLSVITEKRLYSMPKHTAIKRSRSEERKEYSPEFISPPSAASHTFKFYGGKEAQRVCLAIDSNAWDSTNLPLRKVDDHWELTIELPFGEHLYKFVVDGSWHTEQKDPMKSGGNENNYVNIENMSRIIGPMESDSKDYKLNDITYIRYQINKYHSIANKHKSSLFMYQSSHQQITIVRQMEEANDLPYDQIVLVTRASIAKHQEEGENIQTDVHLPGSIHKIVFAANLYVDPDLISAFKPNPMEINGVKGQLFVHTGKQALKYFATVEHLEHNDVIHFSKLPHGFTALILTRNTEGERAALRVLEDMPRYLEGPILQEMDLEDINHLLYKCREEEMDYTRSIHGKERGVYTFGDFSPKYCGLAGLVFHLDKLRRSHIITHPILTNIQEGNWLFDYHEGRISELNTCPKLIEFSKPIFRALKDLPPPLKSKYFARFITKVTECIKSFSLNQMPPMFENTGILSSLGMSIFQFISDVPSAYFGDIKATMSAGLPHFTVGYTRCWGRDTMIAIRGLLLIPRYFLKAREIILQFAAVMRHGLIPNLHDQGNNSRFNARDATWFFMQAIQDYVIMAPQGENILNEVVRMKFGHDNMHKHLEIVQTGKVVKYTLAEIMQIIMESHGKGISYREWNAGNKIDEHMTTNGFNNSIKLERSTGIIYGGCKHNCGTWMDKMGSSGKANNKGIPATPRDGGSVEIIGLLKSALQFLIQLNRNGYYKWDHVILSDESQFTYERWNEVLEESFEKHYWIPENESLFPVYGIDPNKVNHRSIYKDTLNSEKDGSDYQFRPNFLIAMCHAPEMFKPQNALKALDNAQKFLLSKGGMGMRTLSKYDREYNGDYINSDDSDNYGSAQGFNYHNGPEWVWPFGYFLRAKIMFAKHMNTTKQDLTKEIMSLLHPHEEHMKNDAWMSLPELTNSEGKECRDSCKAQAWSISTIIEALFELNQYDN